MAVMTTSIEGKSAPFATDDDRWRAVANRDPAADGAFFYSVKTTGVYCRPVCASRLALRKNVRFYDTCRAAEAAGFRACKRCRPTENSLEQRHAALVVEACRLIGAADGMPRLDDLAASVGMSRFHFHRIFKAQTGVTPRVYAAAQRSERVRNALPQSATVTHAIYGAGFNSGSRFYESSTDTLGMSPKSFRAGGRGTRIRFAVGKCDLGLVLVAATDVGVCAIFLGDDPDALTHDLQDRFPQAELIGGDETFERLVAQVVGFVDMPTTRCELPLDIRGTAFQRRVWAALREIPAGSTASYMEIAQRIGRPKSARAVATACGANPLAVAIPCHRVVRASGDLAGYRWGIERKGELLWREREAGR